MTYVVTKACLGKKSRGCIDVCPVDCFYDVKDPELNKRFGMPLTPAAEAGMLLINPDECIDCGACVAECPVAAIYPAAKLPAEAKGFEKLNAELTLEMTPAEQEASRCVPDDPLLSVK